MVISARMCGTFAAAITRLPVTGLVPPAASVDPMVARSTVETSVEHCRV